MQVLVIGGTEFVGRHLVLAARAAGLDLTLFNRQSTNPGLFSDLERVKGDRTDPDALAALGSRRWDAVVDTCGYLPGDVRASAHALADATDRYLFVSTVSVYAEEELEPGADESAALHPPETEATEVTGATYGPLKVACEQVAQEVFGDRCTVVRPGVVCGPHDPTDRFTWWVERAARGGEMLVPDSPRAVQVIDARDLSELMVRLVIGGVSGTFNAVGPGEPLTLPQLAGLAAEVAGAGARPRLVDPSWLIGQEVRPWQDLPLWLGPDGPEVFGLSAERARAAGLTHRPMTDTVAATLAWTSGREAGERKVGLQPEREEQLLAALDA